MRTRFWLGLIAIAAFAAGSVLAALLFQSNQQRSFERAQHEQALRAAHQAEGLASISVGQLASAAAFYRIEEEMSMDEFRVMANSVLDQGALTGTAFIEAVDADERDDYWREQGLVITERDLYGPLRRAGNRQTYYPLTYAHSKNPGAFKPPRGYDLGSDRTRGVHLRRAGDTGRAAATPTMRLLVGGLGINVFRPVYEIGASTKTVAERRRALIGFATGAFRVPDLIAEATTALPDRIETAILEKGKPIVGADVSRGDAASVPITIADRTWLLVVRDPNRPDAIVPILIAVLGLALSALLAALVVIWSRNERMQQLQLEASQDPLTGIKNRRRFEEDLRSEIARARRQGTTGALLMIDIDNFKLVNDTLGHPTGDRVIEEVAEVLRARTRATDVLARLGGDEFAIVLAQCSLEEALQIGEEINHAIRNHRFAADELPPVAVSIGIAMFGPGSQTSFEAVQIEADAAMYAAKEAGRDQVRVSIPETSPQTQHPVGGGVERDG